MLNWIKKQSVASWILILGAILALVAMIIYIANSTTGILAGTDMNALPIVFSVLAILLLAVVVAVPGKINHWLVSFIMLAVVVLLTVSISLFINGRLDIAGNQWFIPGMETPEQGACLNGAITGVVFYVLAILAVVVSSVIGRFGKTAA